MRIKVILNQKSKGGRSKRLPEILKQRFSRFLVSVEHTAYPVQATEIARHAVNEGVDTVVAVGGDGTLNEVLNGIVGTDAALGIIPSGAANDLASLYEIPHDPVSACGVILERNVRRVDVICINGWYYVTAGGIGLPCEIAQLANAIKGKVGKLAGNLLGNRLYVLVALFGIMRRMKQRNRLEIQWDGHRISTNLLWLMINNQAFLGKHFLMSPGAVNDDGRFDVCTLENIKSRAQILSVMIKVMKGNHLSSPCVNSWRTEELLVSAEHPVAFFGDGEVLPKTSELRIKICPRALHIITPRNSGKEMPLLEPRTQRKQNP